MLVPMSFSLITSAHDDPNLLRRLELLECLNRNVEVFDSVFILYERSSGILRSLIETDCGHNKITFIHVRHRPSFDELFKFSEELGPGRHVCIANADIAFDSSILRLKSQINAQSFFAITRTEQDNEGSVLPNLMRLPSGLPNFLSSDAWCFVTPLRFRLPAFNIGELGCDSALHYQALRAGYSVYNPCMDVTLSHIHNITFNSSDEKLKTQAEAYRQKLKRLAQLNGGTTPISGIPWCWISDLGTEGFGNREFRWSPKSILVLISDNTTRCEKNLNELQSLVDFCEGRPEKIPVWLVSTDSADKLAIKTEQRNVIEHLHGSVVFESHAKTDDLLLNNGNVANFKTTNERPGGWKDLLEYFLAEENSPLFFCDCTG